MPTPAPYPTAGNAIPRTWTCDTRPAVAANPVAQPPVTAQPGGQDCAVNSWQMVSSAPNPTIIVTQVPVQTVTATASPTPTPSTTAASVTQTSNTKDFTTLDNGNWTDLAPWFAGVVVAAIIAPYAFRILVNFIREAFSRV